MCLHLTFYGLLTFVRCVNLAANESEEIVLEPKSEPAALKR